MLPNTYRTVRLILGDQLNAQHSWFAQRDDETLYVLMETRSETDYVRHHIQKVCAFFSAMRHFAAERMQEGHHFLYLQLDDSRNMQSFEHNLAWIFKQTNAPCFEYQLPDEYRLDVALTAFTAKISDSMQVNVVDSEHFLSNRDDLATLFKGKKTYLMETFYRKMRIKYQILMRSDDPTQPQGDRWNFDADNRQKIPKNLVIPPPLHFAHDVTEIIEMLEKVGVQTIGTIDNQRFTWAVTRAECLTLLEHFCTIRLLHFGTYEDAMVQRDYLTFHSKLSFAMNVKLLSPLEVVKTVVAYYEKHCNVVTMAQVEGFVRQIIGWREFMRGVYWAQMPSFATLNFFNHKADLPSFYWTGETKMTCLRAAIGQSLERAYAHHIQRLMVTGNFALLLGVHPDALDEWYLGVYIDALEWVEITNTRGMSQYADGGLVGSKPYVAAANYIDKMSDYCTSCHYDKKLRYGEKACPFNSLYWDFYMRHEDKLARNPRIGMMYQLLKKMTDEEKTNIKVRAEYVKQHVNTL